MKTNNSILLSTARSNPTIKNLCMALAKEGYTTADEIDIVNKKYLLEINLTNPASLAYIELDEVNQTLTLIYQPDGSTLETENDVITVSAPITYLDIETTLAKVLKIIL